MLKYWVSETENNITYSVDMLRFDFTVLEANLQKLIKYMSSPVRHEVESFGISTSPFKYRHLFKVNFQYSSMVVGLGFNGIHGSDFIKCFVEFNPNKVFQSPEAFDYLHLFQNFALKFRLRRWDLALDIPVSRHLVQLVKDRRKYSLVKKSAADMSEYLGSRNEGGFVKLYNKTIESKLNNDVTRLEVTCSKDMGLDAIMAVIPRVLVSKEQIELCLDDDLSPKDRLLVDLLRMHPDMFPRLDRRNRKKFEEYVFGVKNGVEFSRFCVRKLMERIHLFEK